MSDPLVSVVMAVRNGERYLSEAIQSVLEQDYRPLEIVLVDGHSTDRTKAITKRYSELRYVPQQGRGVADAYNLGIRQANGDFVAFLSHDDRWTAGKLRRQMAHLLSHPEVQYTIAKVKFFLEPGCAIPAGFRPELLEGEHVGRIMETLVARKQVFQVVGEFDASLTTAEDVDWYSRAADLQIPMALIEKVLLHKRVHGDNISLRVEENNQNLLQALRQSIARKRARNTVKERDVRSAS